MPSSTATTRSSASSAGGTTSRSIDPDAWRKYKAKFPQADKIADFGNPYAGDFSVEKVIALNADVVVLDLGNYFRARETGLIEKLEKVDIPVVFIDWREDPSPEHAAEPDPPRPHPRPREGGPRLRRLLPAPDAARLHARRQPQGEASGPSSSWSALPAINPNTLLLHLGAGELRQVRRGSGRPQLGQPRLHGTFGGDVNVEKIIADDPDFYFMTGANWSQSNPDTIAVLLGYEATEDKVQERIKGLMKRTGLPLLKATKNKRVMAALPPVLQLALFLRRRPGDGEGSASGPLQGRRPAGGLAGTAREVPADRALRASSGQRLSDGARAARGGVIPPRGSPPAGRGSARAPGAPARAFILDLSDRPGGYACAMCVSDAPRPRRGRSPS